MLGLTGLIKVENQSLQVERIIEEGRQIVSVKLPAVMSVVQSIGEPRYPSFMGIRKASKAEIPVWSLKDLGIPTPVSFVSRLELVTPPSRDITCEIISGDNPAAIAESLADKILAEKVL
jgi:electron transfer flavoprotein beta subunit